MEMFKLKRWDLKTWAAVKHFRVSSQWFAEGVCRIFSLHLLCHGALPHRAGEMSPAGHAWDGGNGKGGERSEKVSATRGGGTSRTPSVCSRHLWTLICFLVWLQHGVVRSQDRSEEKRAAGFLRRTVVHHREGDPWLLLLLWGLWTVSLYVCTAHGHRQGRHRLVQTSSPLCFTSSRFAT